ELQLVPRQGGGAVLTPRRAVGGTPRLDIGAAPAVAVRRHAQVQLRRSDARRGVGREDGIETEAPVVGGIAVDVALVTRRRRPRSPEVVALQIAEVEELPQRRIVPAAGG